VLVNKPLKVQVKHRTNNGYTNVDVCGVEKTAYPHCTHTWPVSDPFAPPNIQFEDLPPEEDLPFEV